MALSATSPSSSTIGLQTRRRGWQGEREAARALAESRPRVGRSESRAFMASCKAARPSTRQFPHLVSWLVPKVGKGR